MERKILHVDMNNFYASVECLYNPELRGKPVAVSGNVEKRHGVILAKSESAKKCGVKTGDTIWQAQRKCPNIIFLPPHFELYEKCSQMAKEIYACYTDKIESFGLDECWLDVTDCIHFNGNAKMLADEIRRRIRDELGLTASVGVSFNKIFAKLGSDMKKPDATTQITRENFKKLVWPLPAGELLFIGRKTKERLLNFGIKTIGDLANANPAELKRLLGKNGTTLHSYANGEDNSPVSSLDDDRDVKSIGNSTTTPRDLITEDDVKITLYALCESVASRLRDRGLVCKTVQINLRDNTLKTADRQGKLEFESCVSSVIFDKALELYRSSGWIGRPIRTLGVRATELSEESTLQMSLLSDMKKMQKREDEERTIDNIRKRFGHFSVQRGIMLSDRNLSEINPKKPHDAPSDKM
ncbi:MAG: DNA polymerase IV [Clostridia bacterium]|nr:DNA polymerase IV [Clostridia bacterium]